jgi:hypothetical protein
MPIYTDRITLVFPIEDKKRAAAASLQTLEVTDSGKEFENLVPLDPALVADYAIEFNLGALGQVTELEAEKTQLTTDLATRTSERDSLQSQVTALEFEKQELNSRIADLDTALDDEQRLTTQLQTRVAELEQYRPFNPRHTTPDFFINRFTAKEAKAFYSSTDPVIVGGQKLLEEYEEADPPYHIDLDDSRVQGLIGYMVQLGMMAAERMPQVLRDATREEAYVV